MTYINVKLPNNVVNISLPPITTTAQALGINPSGVRVTRAVNRRVTRGGNVRVTHYTITCYPEVTEMKLSSNEIAVHVVEN